YVRRRGLEHHLVLVVMLQAIGILAVAAVLWPARRLHIRRVPGLRTDRAQESRRMKGTCADLHVVGLQQHAAAAVPERVQLENQLLESKHQGFFDSTGWRLAMNTAAPRSRSEAMSTGQSPKRTYGVAPR